MSKHSKRSVEGKKDTINLQLQTSNRKYIRLPDIFLQESPVHFVIHNGILASDTNNGGTTNLAKFPKLQLWFIFFWQPACTYKEIDFGYTYHIFLCVPTLTIKAN